MTLSIRYLLLLPALLLPFQAALAEELPSPVTVHVAPDSSAPVIGSIAAGAPLPRTTLDTPPPAGWVAVELAGRHTGFVPNSHIGKNLKPKAGAPVHADPSADSPLLTTLTAQDAAELSGLRGDWTEITFEKPLVGYVRVPSAPAASAVAVPTPQPPPAQPPTQPGFASGKAADSSGMLPRLYHGRFERARRFILFGAPYEYQLNDPRGNRFAFLDLKRLLLTEAIEKYTGRIVAVYGTVKAVPDSKEIVIEVESLRLQ